MQGPVHLDVPCGTQSSPQSVHTIMIIVVHASRPHRHQPPMQRTVLSWTARRHREGGRRAAVQDPFLAWVFVTPRSPYEMIIHIISTMRYGCWRGEMITHCITSALRFRPIALPPAEL